MMIVSICLANSCVWLGLLIITPSGKREYLELLFKSSSSEGAARIRRQLSLWRRKNKKGLDNGIVRSTIDCKEISEMENSLQWLFSPWIILFKLAFNSNEQGRFFAHVSMAALKIISPTELDQKKFNVKLVWNFANFDVNSYDGQ